MKKKALRENVCYSVPFSGTVSLRMLQVSVPQYPEVGQSVELLCQFELQGEKLYTVSWYKDFNELYRFVPRGSPKQHVYWIDGIKVNVSIGVQPCKQQAEYYSKRHESSQLEFDHRL